MTYLTKLRIWFNIGCGLCLVLICGEAVYKLNWWLITAGVTGSIIMVVVYYLECRHLSNLCRLMMKRFMNEIYGPAGVKAGKKATPFWVDIDSQYPNLFPSPDELDNKLNPPPESE